MRTLLAVSMLMLAWLTTVPAPAAACTGVEDCWDSIDGMDGRPGEFCHAFFCVPIPEDLSLSGAVEYMCDHVASPRYLGLCDPSYPPPDPT